MLFNYVLGIYCFECKKYLTHYEVLLNVLYEGSITCDKDHIIGNTWDLQWQEFIGDIGEEE
jgi:hypothetical protein